MAVVQKNDSPNRLPAKPVVDDTEEVVDEGGAEGDDSGEEAPKGEAAEGSEGESSTDDLTPEKYLSVDSLPEELKPMGKKMLAAHTKAMQKIAEERKSFAEELGTKYAREVQQANVLRQLSALPEFKNFWADVEAGKPYGFSSVYAKTKPGVDTETDDDSDSGELTPKKVEAMIASAVAKAVAPFHKDNSQAELSRIKENYPSFEKHRAAVYQYIEKNPASSLESALWAVAGKELAEEAAAKAIAEAQSDAKSLANKKLHTEKPSTSTGSPATSKKGQKTYNNPSEALRDAMSELLG